MDRSPLPPPFAIGTLVRYNGTRESFTYDINPETGERKLVPILAPGLIVTIDDTKQGRQGSLHHLKDEDGLMWDDTGEPVLDTTTDGYSIYYVEVYQNGRKLGRCILPENAHDWEEVKDWGGDYWPVRSWDDKDCHCSTLDNHGYCPIHGYPPIGGQLASRYKVTTD